MAGLFELANRKPDPFDYEGALDTSTTDAEKRLAPIYEKIDTIEGMAGDIESWDEWVARTGTQLNEWDTQVGAMGDIADRAAAGPTEEDYNAAFGQSARMLGYGSEEEMNAAMNAMRDAEQGDMAGMGDVEMQVRQRANQAMLREMEARETRMVENTFSDTGSTIRMLQSADEATSKINNVQLQQAAALINEDAERAFAQLQVQKQQWQQELQVKTITVSQYMENLQTGMDIALQGYAQQIEGLWRENQQYLQQFTADRDALVASIDAMYNAAVLELGAAQAEIDMMAELYAAQVQPELDALTRRLAEQELGRICVDHRCRKNHLSGQTRYTGYSEN